MKPLSAQKLDGRVLVEVDERRRWVKLLPDARDGPWHGPGLTGQVDAGSAPGCVFLATVGLHAHPTCEVTDTQQQHAATLPIICHSLTQSGGKADERLTKMTQVKRAVPDRGGSVRP
jgi:hypothetical protein